MSYVPYAYWASQNVSAVTRSELIGISTTSWTAPYGISSIEVECWGAGGQGGRATVGAYNYYGGTVTSGGGGGGAYAKKTISITGGQTYDVFVDTEGSEGSTYFIDTSTVKAESGKNGENTAIGTRYGGGGLGGKTTNSIGDTKYAGGNGAGGGTTYGGGGGGGAGSLANGNNASTSNGGNAQSENGGKGGDGGTISPIDYGEEGADYGAGGGGSRLSNNTQSTPIINGADGLIRITYTFQ